MLIKNFLFYALTHQGHPIKRKIWVALDFIIIIFVYVYIVHMLLQKKRKTLMENRGTETVIKSEVIKNVYNI